MEKKQARAVLSSIAIGEILKAAIKDLCDVGGDTKMSKGFVQAELFHHCGLRRTADNMKLVNKLMEQAGVKTVRIDGKNYYKGISFKDGRFPRMIAVVSAKDGVVERHMEGYFTSRNLKAIVKRHGEVRVVSQGSQVAILVP